MFVFQSYLEYYFKFLELNNLTKKSSYIFDGDVWYYTYLNDNNEEKTIINLPSVLETVDYDIKFTVYLDDHNIEKNIFYIPFTIELQEFYNQRPEINTLLHGYNFLLRNYKLPDLLEGFLDKNKTNLIAFPFWRGNSKYIQRYIYEFRNSFFAVKPKIEIFAISKYDFNSHIHILSSIQTSLLSGSQIFLYSIDFDLKDTKIYSELINSCNFEEIEKNVYLLKKKDNFNDLYTLNKNKIKNYINSILNGDLNNIPDKNDILGSLK